MVLDIKSTCLFQPLFSEWQVQPCSVQRASWSSWIPALCTEGTFHKNHENSHKPLCSISHHPPWWCCHKRDILPLLGVPLIDVQHPQMEFTLPPATETFPRISVWIPWGLARNGAKPHDGPFPVPLSCALLYMEHPCNARETEGWGYQGDSPPSPFCLIRGSPYWGYPL